MKLSRWVFALAMVGAIMLVTAGPGTQMELWNFRFGFQLMRWAVYVSAAAGVLSLLLIAFRRQRQGQMRWIMASFWIAIITAYVPLSLLQKVQSVPRIHDITTDFDQVPAFVAIAPLRANAPNPLEYPGEEVARLQKGAYPDIVSYETQLPRDQLFNVALGVVDELGWTLVDANLSEGRIEASDKTLWFGFIDDVVIRIEATADGSKVDVRSKSRVGMSDVGKNAERIRQFMQTLDQRQ